MPESQGGRGDAPHSQHALAPDLQQPDGEVRLKGEVRTISYQNEESGFTVARLSSPDEPGDITIVGRMGGLTPGEMLELWGHWKEHPRFGSQFEVSSFVQTYPATENGIIRFLSSGLIKGVGRATAERMVARFGTGVLDILDDEPERLLEVDKIGEKKLEGIKESWREQREVRGLMLFLQSHEVSTTYASRIFEIYGTGAVGALQENPYELAYRIKGVGFRTADRMAQRLGFAPDSPQRVEAATVYRLHQLSDQGHLFTEAADLYPMVSEMLGGIDEDRFEDALERLAERKRVVVMPLPAQNVERAVYLHLFYRQENEAATRVQALLDHPCGRDLAPEVESMLPELESEARLTLSSEQREAVLGALSHKAYIVTGGPGTGKTTITRMIVRAMERAGLKLRLAAPTGRAAKRLSEAAGHEASTLHRLLQFQPGGGFGKNEESKLRAQAVIVDEASMLDIGLFVALLRALPLTCRLILVGDVNQLPSVGPGNVLADLLDSECVPHLRLTRIYRQALQSGIVRNAHRVNQGEFPQEDGGTDPPEKDFWWIRQDDPARVRALVESCVLDRIPAAYGLDPIKDIQVLTPMHKGEVGTQTLNERLQEGLNPLRPGMAEIRRGSLRLRQGDRVLQTRNNYDKEVFNGDLGLVEEVDPQEGAMVDIDGRSIVYDLADLDELKLAYAVSVHKSQGSEYPAVVVPLLTQHFVLLQRNLLYTALTRARSLVVLVGGHKAVALALKNTRSFERNTNLRYRLQELCNQPHLL